jgi:hypothetical protein
MPSAPEELRDKFPGLDDEAREALYAAGYKDAPGRVGCWLKPSADHVPTPRETDALDYLWMEWDYGDIVGYVGDPEDPTQKSESL